MKLNKTRRLVCGSLLAALIALMTACFKLPLPNINGYIHPGDGAVFLCALLLGPFASVPAAVGSALADALFGYYVYMLPTFLIKGLMGLIAGLAAGRTPRFTLRKLIVWTLCGLIMTGGYFLFELLLYGAGAALTAVIPNLIQAATGVVTGCLFIPAARRLPPI